MRVDDANLEIIFDSRQEETLRAELKSGDFSVSASVPSGKSRGAHEAFVLAPKEALSKFETIKLEILNRDFGTQEEFDNFLISLDGTPDKKNLGGNLILALSLAWARLKAKEEGRELFQYIHSLIRLPITNYQLPHPIFNVINGGVHATNSQSKLNFQEFQIIPVFERDSRNNIRGKFEKPYNFGIAYGLGKKFYKELKELLEKKFGKENVLLGDEEGFSAPFKNNEEALEILTELIAIHNYPLRIGLDAAANQFYKDDTYVLSGKKYSAEELKNVYLKLIDAYNILLLEDPFYEESFDDFSLLSHVKVMRDIKIVTDDLTATNPERLKIAIEKKSGNTILIKLNQIGTLTETLKVVKLAYENNWETIVSHRSGETMDDFIADLAVGIGAWGIKAGAPAAPERIAKYNRVLEILNPKL